MEHKKFEYYVTTFDMGVRFKHPNKSKIQWLADKGEKGWELVTTNYFDIEGKEETRYYGEFIFKRPLLNTPV